MTVYNSVTRFSLVLLFLKRIGRILQQELVFPTYSIMVYISVSNIPSISCQVIGLAAFMRGRELSTLVVITIDCIA